MTRQDIEALGYYEQRLARLRDELSDMEAMIGVGSPALDGMPHGGRTGDPTQSLAVRLATQIDKIRVLERQTMEARLRVYEWLETLDDEMIREIIYLKFLKHCTWREVALRIGYGDHTTYFKMYEAFWRTVERQQ